MNKCYILLTLLIAGFTGALQGSELKVKKATELQINLYDAYFKEHHERHIQEVTELVAIPTLAMVKEHAPDLVKGAQYLAAKMKKIGLQEVKVHPAGGFPFVTGEWMKAKGEPTAVFYGHFDIQPVVKEQWNTDPFKATLKDGKLYGRGATDDKGYIICILSTIEAMLEKDGRLPVNVKFIFDGSEEFGSQTMSDWLAQKDMSTWIKQADYGFNVDAMMQSDDQGLMWRGLRGGVDVDVKVTVANTAVHSGIYGGSAPNAVHAAAKMIGSIFNDDGSVAIEGFQADVTRVSDTIRKELKVLEPSLASTFDKKKLSIAQWIGDKHFTVLEHTVVRNSLDVTGITGGFEGKASIVPPTAWFRMLARTGPGQDPAKLGEKIVNHLKKHTPWQAKVEITATAAGSAPYFSQDHHGFKIGHAVLTDFFGKAPQVSYIGGGVPALSYVPDAGGPGLVSFGFQRSDEGFHADNEYMRVESFKNGQRAYALLLHALVGQPARK